MKSLPPSDPDLLQVAWIWVFSGAAPLSNPSSVNAARGRRTGGAPSARHSARSGPTRGSSPLDTWSRQARRLPQQNTERPAGNRRNVKSKQSAPVSNELSDPFTLQSTQVIKLDQRQEAFSTKQHACVQLESKSSFGKELSFGHHYKQVRCFNSDQINAKPIDQCHLHVSSMSENVVGHHLRCHPLIRQMTLTMTGANLRWGAPRFLRITQKFNFSL